MRPARTLPTTDDMTDRAVLRDGSVVAAPSGGASRSRRAAALLPRACRSSRCAGASSASPNRRTRYSTASAPSTDLAQSATLLALRSVDGELRADRGRARTSTASASSAEVAFAVDDHFQGKGPRHRPARTSGRDRGGARLHALRGDDARRQRGDARRVPRIGLRDPIRSRSADVSTCSCSLDADRPRPSPPPNGATRSRRRRRCARCFEPRVGGGGRRVARPSGASAAACCARSWPAASAVRSIPINPNATRSTACAAIRRSPTCPRGVDLAVVAVPSGLRASRSSTSAPRSASSRSCVITAGFAESGAEGRALQQRLRRQGARLRACAWSAPTAWGCLNADPAFGLNASFSPIVPPAGRVALSSQSGALGMAILELARERGVGLSTFVSVGNKADVSGNDLLQYWEADPQHVGHPALPRVVRQPATVRAAGAAHRPHEADRRRQGRANQRRLARGRQPHRGARRERHRRRRAVSSVRRHSRRHDRRDVRHRRVPRRAAAAGRTPRRRSSPTPADRASSRSTPAKPRACVVAPFGADTRGSCPRSCRPKPASATRWTWSRRPGPPNTGAPIEVVLPADETDALIVIYTPVDPLNSAETLAAIRDGIGAARAAGATGKPILACVMAGTGRPQPLVAGDERIPAFVFPENAARALAKVATYARVAPADAGPVLELRRHPRRRSARRVQDAPPPPTTAAG